MGTKYFKFIQILEFKSAYSSAEEIRGQSYDSLLFPQLQFHAHEYVYIFKHVEILWGEY